MTRTEFEAALRADGFTEIETKTLPPRPANGEHGHHYDVRGLVLGGIFTVIQNDKPVHYRTGDTFFVANGDLHCEEIGEAGAEICVGKRY
jgi:quercetin dioxygenase-like cupin family protein